MTDRNSVDTEAQESNREVISRRQVLVGATALGFAGVGASTLPSLGTANSGPTEFSVTIENIGGPETVNGSPFVISPGAFASHKNGAPIFSKGAPERNNGLEEVAEDGTPGRLAGVLENAALVYESGTFGEGPLTPGSESSYTFSVEAKPPYEYLSLVTMFVQSNDLFYAIGGHGGIDLFDGNEAIEGDVTSHLRLWDAGTEINEQPGHGQNQAPRQKGAGLGLVERGTIVPIKDVNGYDYPNVTDVLTVTVDVE